MIKKILKNTKKTEEIAFILKELSVLLKGGITLPRALELLAKQNKNFYLELLELKSLIEQGEELSQAFKKVQIFPDFLCEMLIAAQTGGNLEEIFAKASNWLANIEEFKENLKNALLYPTIVLTLSIIAIIIVLEFIVPKLRKVLLSFGEDLPFITKMLILIAKITGITFLFGIPFLIIGIIFLKKKKGTIELHRLGLKLPIFGKIWRLFELSRFCYTASLLLEAGIVLPRAVLASANTCSNIYLKENFLKIVKKLEEGGSFSLYLKKFTEIPEFLNELISVGEETGTLSQMLQNASELLTKEIDYFISRTIKWIEPITILLLGGIVAYIVISVILPIMKISSSIKM